MFDQGALKRILGTSNIVACSVVVAVTGQQHNYVIGIVNHQLDDKESFLTRCNGRTDVNQKRPMDYWCVKDAKAFAIAICKKWPHLNLSVDEVASFIADNMDVNTPAMQSQSAQQSAMHVHIHHHIVVEHRVTLSEGLERLISGIAGFAEDTPFLNELPPPIVIQQLGAAIESARAELPSSLQLAPTEEAEVYQPPESSDEDDLQIKESDAEMFETMEDFISFHTVVRKDVENPPSFGTDGWIAKVGRMDVAVLESIPSEAEFRSAAARLEALRGG